MAGNRESNVVLNFKMNGQVQYANSLKQLNMVMQTASKEYQAQVTAMGRNADASEKLRAEKQKLETQLAASTEKVEMLRDKFNAMQNDSNATAEDLQKLYNQLLAAETAHSKMGQAMERVNEGLSEEAIASRKAKEALKGLSDDAKKLEAEKRKLASTFALENQALGENATETEKASLAQRQYQQQTQLMQQSIRNLETQIDKARVAYGENSVEVLQLETRLNQARGEMTRFTNEFNRVPSEAEKAKKALKDMGEESKRLDAEQRRLISTFELERQALGKNASETEKAALAQRHHEQQVELSRRAIAQMEQQLESTKRAYGANSIEVMQLETNLNQARAELNRFENGLNDVSQDADKAGVSLDSMGDKAKTMAKALSAALAAFAGASLIAAGQFDDAVGQIQAGLGLTRAEAEKLEDEATALWKRGFGESLEEVAAGLIRVKQNMRLIDSSEIQEVTKNALSLSKAFEADVVEVTRGANNLMANFGITAKQAFDMLAKGAQNGLNFSNELFDNVAEYAPLWADMGFSVEQMFGVLESGVQSGVYNLDYLNDVMKEFQIRATDGSKSTTEAVAELGPEVKKVWKEFSNGNSTVAEMSQTTVTELAKISDKVKQNELGVALFGTKWEDLGGDVVLAMLQAGRSMTEFEGAMNSVTDAQENTFGQRWESFTRTAAASLEPVGLIMLEIAEEWLPKIIDKVEGAATWFSELSQSGQKTVLVLGAIAAAAGPLIMVGGTLVFAISSVVTLFGAGGAAAGVFGSALGVLTGPVGWAALGIAAIGTAAVVTAKQMSESSIEIEDWSKDVSEATAEAVGGFVKLSDDAGQQLSELYLTSTSITDEMATELTGKFDTMYTKIVDAAKVKHQEQLDSLSEFFMNSSALSSEEEAKIIEKRKQSNEFELEILAAKNDIVAEIMQKAADENRALTERERNTINNINQQMKEDAVRVLSESEMEQKVILEKMKADATEISALQAAEVVKKSVEQKEKVIAEANAQYEQSIAHITRLRDETGDISTEQAEKMIAEAKKSRDQTIGYAEQMHEDVIAEAKAQAGEHVAQVDWETGQVKSKWEVMKTNVSSKMKEIGNDVKNGWNNTWGDVKTFTTNIVNTAEDKFEEVRDKITSKIESSRQAISDAIDAIKGFFSGLKLELPDIKMPKLPHFKVTGEFSLNPPSVPKLGIEWYANGGIMTRPTAFGINGNNIMAGGEAGPEAILPLNRQNLGAIGEAISATMKGQMPTHIVVQSILDGRIIAEQVTPFVSQNQYRSNSITAVMKGVTP